MYKELVELRALLLKRANDCVELAEQLDMEEYSHQANAFCTALVDLDRILLKSMKVKQ